MTKDFSRYVFNVGVAYREDVDAVINVLKKIDEELRNDPEFKDDITEPLEVLGLDSFGDSALSIKARTTTKPIKQWRIGREFNRRMKKRFDELNIEIPFPHRTIYFGVDKNGAAPPVNVKSTSAA
jgi:small conductance mechanosensitive channel